MMYDVLRRNDFSNIFLREQQLLAGTLQPYYVRDLGYIRSPRLRRSVETKYLHWTLLPRLQCGRWDIGSNHL